MDYQGYSPQSSYPQQGYQQSQTPAPLQTTQLVKFYKSGVFGFSSAAGRYQRDWQKMISQGWQVKQQAYLGTNFWLRRIIAVVYER